MTSSARTQQNMCGRFFLCLSRLMRSWLPVVVLRNELTEERAGPSYFYAILYVSFQFTHELFRKVEFLWSLFDLVQSHFKKKLSAHCRLFTVSVRNDFVSRLPLFLSTVVYSPRFTSPLDPRKPSAQFFSPSLSFVLITNCVQFSLTFSPTQSSLC